MHACDRSANSESDPWVARAFDVLQVRPSPFYDDYVEAELGRLRSRYELAIGRAQAAKQSYERARQDSLSPEERARTVEQAD